MLRVILTTAAIGMAFPAYAESAASASVARSTTPTAKEGEKICKMVALTGTRQKKKICQTAEEWGTKN